MSETLERAKTYLTFNKDEFLDIIIAICIITFIFYFGKKEDIGMFSALLIVALSMLFHITAQKIAALKVGFKAEYKIWWYGLLASIMFVFISRGVLWWIILPGGITFSLMAGLRIGRFRYGLNYTPMGAIGLVGPVASIILATIFKNIEIYLIGEPNLLFHNIFIFNIAYAICTLLPIPPLDGHYMFYASRTWYVLIFSTILFYAIFSIWLNLFSWIAAITVGIIILITYFIKVEM